MRPSLLKNNRNLIELENAIFFEGDYLSAEKILSVI